MRVAACALKLPVISDEMFALLVWIAASTASSHSRTGTRHWSHFGSSACVGTAGLSAILITSDAGHILIDGALPQSAALIEANIRTLGFQPRDVRLILNSHEHYDHAGGLGLLQRATGARVAASPSAAQALRQGRPTDRIRSSSLASRRRSRR